MIVRYDALNRLEKPMLTLCNPGSICENGALTKVVGILTDHEAEECVFNFNATSELNFRIKRVRRENAEDNYHIRDLFKKVQNRRLIFMDDIGYFMITEVKDGYSDGETYKDVTAKSIDIEIQQKTIPYIADGTYQFYDGRAGANAGLLEKVVSVLPMWTIGDVDGAVAQRYRTFEDVDVTTNCLSFLLENMQEAYECIVLFDIINRTINVYDQANYVRQTSIHITKDDVINSIDIKENADDIYTALRVLGDDNVTISAINPTGDNVIYNFDYYLGWMTPSLSAKVRTWQGDIESAKSQYFTRSLEYYRLYSSAIGYQAEIDKLQAQLTIYRRCRDNIVAESGKESDEAASELLADAALIGRYNAVILDNGGRQITVSQTVKDTTDEIDELISDCVSSKATNEMHLASTNQSLYECELFLHQINSTLAIQNYFTQAEYDELYHYIFEGSYNDEYVIVTDSMSYRDKFEQMRILLDRAEKQLEKASKPTQEFDIDIDNFLFAKEFEHWSEQLETGCLINVELDDHDVALLFLSNITVNYDDHQLSMTFGNRFNKFDAKSMFENVLGSVSKSANTLNYVKDMLYPIKSGEFNSMKDALQTSRNLTLADAISSTGEEVVIDESGYTGRRMINGEYDPHQVKISGRNIVFTNDAWDTCKVAIGMLQFQKPGEESVSEIYGINAEAIIGEMIIGAGIRIVDSNGEDLFSIVDGKITTQVAPIVSDLNSLSTSFSTYASQTQEDIEFVINKISNIDEITTSTGYTFNQNGLTITRTDSGMKNLLDHRGMVVSRVGTNEDVLVANNDGVDAINLTARQYLMVGQHCRFENYIDENDRQRTACFAM